VASFLGTVADTLLKLEESEKSQIIAAITAGEGGIESVISSAINTITVPAAYAPIWMFAKPVVINALVTIEQANPGSVLYPMLDGLAKEWAKELGG
jgi:hypothetical protein